MVFIAFLFFTMTVEYINYQIKTNKSWVSTIEIKSHLEREYLVGRALAISEKYWHSCMS